MSNNGKNVRGFGEQHTLLRSVMYHLFPGAVILATYVALVPSVTARGLPPLLALLVAALLGAVLIQLGHLLYLGRTRNQRWSLRNVVLYREPIKAVQYLLFVPLLALAAFALVFLTTPADKALAEKLIAWLPAWFFYSDPSKLSRS
jgi:hypothetical protein